MRKKVRSIAAWTVTLLSMLILAMALVDVRLRPPGSWYGTPTLDWRGGALSIDTPTGTGLALRVLLIVLAVPTSVAIIASLFSREGRKRLVLYALIFAAVFIVVEVFSRVSAPPAGDQSGPAEEQWWIEQQPPVTPGEAAETRPPWLVWATAAGIAVAAAAAATGVCLALARRLGRGATAREQVAEEARAAIESLRAGEDLRGVVIRCYAQMLGIVREARGIRRAAATTPREFQQELEAASLPSAAVRELTGVFEQVRYGQAEPGPDIERLAMDSLSRIVAFCRSAE